MINLLKKFIENLAKANKESFNGRPLDCCMLNKTNKSDKLKQSK